VLSACHTVAVRVRFAGILSTESLDQQECVRKRPRIIVAELGERERERERESQKWHHTLHVFVGEQVVLPLLTLALHRC
jgi:hypothetical protein